LAICLVALVKSQFIDYDELAGDYGLRKLSKKFQRSTGYQQQQTASSGYNNQQQPSGNYGQQQNGGAGYPQQQATPATYQQPQQAPAGVNPQPANPGYQPENQKTTAGASSYQTEKPTAYAKGSNSYDTKVKPFD
jgi:hypothetical protein